MASYLITGVSRGIGYEFLRQYSSDPANVVVGIVRHKEATVTKISGDPDLKGRSNIHILEADVTDYNALKTAAEDTANITAGGLDHLIANAGYVSQFDAYSPIGVLGAKPDELTKTMRDLFDINVIANIHLFNLFTPLLLKGKAKKVITISSGLADPDATRQFDLVPGSLYASTKAAMNLIVAKFSAQYKQDGLLFLSLSPGMVDVGHYANATEEQMQGLGGMMGKFVEYAPHFKGPDTPENSVMAMRKVIEDVSIEKGHGGDFLSHLGNKKWL